MPIEIKNRAFKGYKNNKKKVLGEVCRYEEIVSQTLNDLKGSISNAQKIVDFLNEDILRDLITATFKDYIHEIMKEKEEGEKFIKVDRQHFKIYLLRNFFRVEDVFFELAKKQIDKIKTDSD